MKRITVYADFDFLPTPQEIGILGYERVRGNDHFVFEYSREWLQKHGGIILSGDLLNMPSMQHPRGNVKRCYLLLRIWSAFSAVSMPER